MVTTFASTFAHHLLGECFEIFQNVVIPCSNDPNNPHNIAPTSVWRQFGCWIDLKWTCVSSTNVESICLNNDKTNIFRKQRKFWSAVEAMFKKIQICFNMLSIPTFRWTNVGQMLKPFKRALMYIQSFSTLRILSSWPTCTHFSF